MIVYTAILITWTTHFTFYHWFVRLPSPPLLLGCVSHLNGQYSNVISVEKSGSPQEGADNELKAVDQGLCISLYFGASTTCKVDVRVKRPCLKKTAATCNQ